MCHVALELQAKGLPCAPQVLDEMSKMNERIMTNQQEVRASLLGDPSLARAFLLAQLVPGMVNGPGGHPEVASQPQHEAEPLQGEGPDAVLGTHAVLSGVGTTWQQQQHVHCMLSPDRSRRLSPSLSNSQQAGRSQPLPQDAVARQLLQV